MVAAHSSSVAGGLTARLAIAKSNQFVWNLPTWSLETPIVENSRLLSRGQSLTNHPPSRVKSSLNPNSGYLNLSLRTGKNGTLAPCRVFGGWWRAITALPKFTESPQKVPVNPAKMPPFVKIR